MYISNVYFDLIGIYGKISFGGFMKSITKKLSLAGLGAACALTLTLGAGLLATNGGVAKADSGNGAPSAKTFFYNYLLDANDNEYTLAKKFYKALETLNDNGEFLDGVVDYRIDDIVSSDQLKAWVVDGDLEIPRAFGAARDAFLTDHPELFYINFYKMTISVARSNGNYVGYINSGREANLYYDNGFNTTEKVAAAINKFNARINEIVDIVNALEEADTYTARDAYLAKEVNRYLAENIDYDYDALENKDDPNYMAEAYINTSYGGLVEGYAVCGGYSTAYKVIMDKLGIPCITVNGYSNNKDQNGNNFSTSVSHMWNYVWLETPAATQSKARAAASKGEWYSVDVTWDYTAANKYRFALLNSYTDKEIHVVDGVISTSGYRLRYPSLSAFNYGSTGETDGLQSSIQYTPTDSVDDNGGVLMDCNITVSYNGKSAKRLLEEDGLYLAYRNASYRNIDGKMELAWTDWASLEVFRQFATIGVDNVDQMIQDTGTETRYYDNTSVYYTQFAVFDVKPDRASPNSNPNPTLGHDPETESYYFFFFSNDKLEKTSPLDIGDVIINEAYGTYTPPPYVQDTNHNETITISDSMRDPVNSQFMAESNAFILEVTYDEELEIIDPNEKIGISFVSEHPDAHKYAKFFPVNANGDLVELIKKPRNSSDPTEVTNTLRFKFAPSLLYAHNEEFYNFYFINVGSSKMLPVFGNGTDNEPTGEKPSHKLPNPANFSFGRVVIACPAFYNYDGRLYIDCCAQPTLISNSDLSAMNFKDEDGNSTFTENQRSQMMLVAEKASTDTVNEILNGIGEIEGSQVTKEDIHTSETYDIYLQMCGKYPTISDGSYVKIALGFPENYGPDDEGVTFKLFHRKHVKGDEYIIEEIPCVVTKFGIVATVTSFSPYMVAVVDADKAAEKNIYASIEGKGGKLSLKDGKIKSLSEGESCTYTIKPDEGYQIYSVTLNGVDVTANVTGDKLTLDYADLEANNELVIQYIADAAKARIQEKLDNKDIEETVEVKKYVVAVADQPVYKNVPLPTPPVASDSDVQSNNTVTVIVVCVFFAVAVIAITVTVVVAVRKKKI